MYDFQKLCHALKQAISLPEAPQFVLEPGVSFQDPHDVQGKLKFLHECRLAKLPENKRYQLSCIGSCSIDNFTGFELLKILHDLLEKPDICEPGNYLCFLVNGEARAAVEIHNAWSHTAPISNKKLRRMFSKLFDDDEVQRRKRYPEKKPFYLQEDIDGYRLKAKLEFPQFLRQNFSNFMDRNGNDVIQMPLWNSFFGLLVDIAITTNKRQNLESVRSDVPGIGCIPCLACVKFAFDFKESGKIRKLFGEIGGHETRNKSVVNQRQAQCIVDTAEHLISMAIPASDDEKWDVEQVKKVVDEVKRFYFE